MSVSFQVIQIVGGAIAGLGTGSGLVAIIKALSPGERKRIAAEEQKLGADAAQVISSTAVNLLAPMEHRIQVLQQELDECQSILRKGG